MVERGFLLSSLWSRLQAVYDTTDNRFVKYPHQGDTLD